MPRKRYPSDDARRRTKPAVRIHHSIRNHPRYAHVFADPELRGMWLGLMVIASERHAGKTGDVVTLSAGDLVWITGRSHLASAERAMRRLCGSLGLTGELPVSADGARANLPVTARGRSYRVHVRNFSRKQGHTPHSAGGGLRTPPASESESESESEEDTPSGSGDVVAKRAECWVNLLGREPGDRDQKLRWLCEELPRIEAEAEAAFPKGKPDERAVNAKVRSLVIGWYRQHLRNPSGARGRRPEPSPHRQTNDESRFKGQPGFDR